LSLPKQIKNIILYLFKYFFILRITEKNDILNIMFISISLLLKHIEWSILCAPWVDLYMFQRVDLRNELY